MGIFPQETRDYEIFASHNIDSMDPMDPPENTSRSPIQCVRTMVGRGFGREKSKDPPFEKAGKSPKTKSHGQVARRLSKFDTRLAEVRWKNGSIPNVSLSKFDSCGSPFEDLEPIHAAPTTPLKPRGNTSRLRHRSISILDKRNIRFLGNLCVRDLPS